MTFSENVDYAVLTFQSIESDQVLVPSKWVQKIARDHIRKLSEPKTAWTLHDIVLEGYFMNLVDARNKTTRESDSEDSGQRGRGRRKRRPTKPFSTTLHIVNG